MNPDAVVPNQPPALDPGTVRLAITGESPGIEETTWHLCANGHGFGLEHWENRQLVTRDRCPYCGNQALTHKPTPFVGESGRLLNTLLKDAGLPRERCWVGNVSRLPLAEGEKTIDKNRGGLARLAYDLSQFRPNCVLALGGLALQAFLGADHRFGTAITNWRGSTFEARIGGDILYAGTDKRPSYKVVAACHPAAILREPSQLALLRKDVARAASEAADPALDTPRRVVDAPNDAYAVIEAIQRLRARREPVGFDIEGGVETGVTVLSFADTPLHALSVPFRRMDWSRVWNDADERFLWAAIRDVLEDAAVPKVFHNAAFESFALRWLHGIRIRNVEDSMLAWHAIYPELDKALDVVASILTRQPYWGTTKHWRTDADRDTYNCLMRGTRVLTERGGQFIQDIVRKRDPVQVLTLNEQTGAREWKPVVGWHRTVVKKPQAWWNIRVDRGEGRGIVCTHDHQILTTRGRILAAEVAVGDRVLMPYPAVSEDYVGSLLGTILGDATLHRRNPNGLAQVSAQQKGKALIAEKVRLFGGVQTMRPGHVSGYSSVPTMYSNWYLEGTPTLSRLLDWLRPSGRRIALTEVELGRLTPLGWALWFMDDGCRQRNKKGADSIHLAVCRYSRESQECLTAWLRARFGRVSLQKCGSVYFGARAAMNFCHWISPHVIPEYRYKLSIEGRPYQASVLPPTAGFDWLPVVSSSPFRYAGIGSGFKRVRYCLSVADNHNFFTTGGLVSNCIDSCVCLEAWQAIQRLDEWTPAVRGYYEHAKALLEPCHEMSFHGLAYDAPARDALVAKLRAEVYALTGELDSLAGIAPPTFAEVAQAVCMKVKLPQVGDWDDVLTYAKPTMRENV